MLHSCNLHANYFNDVNLLRLAIIAVIRRLTRAAICNANYFSDDAVATNGCEAGRPTVTDATCDTCSDLSSYTAVTCTAYYWNDDSDTMNGCGADCPTVEDAASGTCSDSSTCATATCNANYFSE